jgi:hypothetical protein
VPRVFLGVIGFGTKGKEVKNTLPCAIIKTHGKHMSLPCVGNNTHGKVFLKELHLVYSECVRGEKYFAVRYNKNARQTHEFAVRRK